MVSSPVPKAQSGYRWYLAPSLAGLCLLLQCLYVIGSRLFYPYELEWIEGGMLQAVMRLRDGLSLYATPTMDYVPPLYAPLYFHVSALVTHVVGQGLPALRLVSFMAAFCSAVMVAIATCQLTRSRWAGWLAFCCWGAVFRFSGFWYDVGRVDSLWACCITAAVVSLVQFRLHGKQAALWLALGALVLAIFSKQTTLMLVPFFLLAVWAWAGLVRAVLFAMTLGLLTAVVVALLQWQSDGLFFFYTMQMAGEHRFNPGIPKNFLEGDLLFGVPVYLLLAVAFIAMQWRERRDAAAWSALLAGFLLMSLLSRWYSGGYFNVLLPLHQLLLLMGISSFGWLVARWGVIASNGWQRAGLVLLTVLLTLNIAYGWYRPSGMIPNAADRACGDTLVSQLAAVEGQVCVSRHPYLAFLAGKGFCAHEAFAVDVMNGSKPALAEALVANIRERLLAGEYAVLLLDNQAQFSGYGVNLADLSYTVTDIDCPATAFYPRITGQRPLHWLQYNGTGLVDLRSVQ